MTESATKNVLIVGAGPGFAHCTAREFGSQGWTVHLLARSRSGLDSLAASLADDVADVYTYVGDVTDHAVLSQLIGQIDAEHHLDACVFQPRGGDDLVDVLDANVDNVRPNLELLVLGGVAVAQALVPRMAERGSGCLVFVGGGSARAPLPVFGNLGMAMAGLRTYALTLNAALADRGVHCAFYTVAGMIGTESRVKTGQLDPRLLAERMYSLVTDRDAREVLMTPDGEVVPKGAR
jgi:NADP-dependent 3-hydroxy acid dehydrogenase YdfG